MEWLIGWRYQAQIGFDTATQAFSTILMTEPVERLVPEFMLSVESASDKDPAVTLIMSPHQEVRVIADQSTEDLNERHTALDKQIRIEASRRVPDEDALAAMKKEKLAIKDQLAGHVGAD